MTDAARTDRQEVCARQVPRPVWATVIATLGILASVAPLHAAETAPTTAPAAVANPVESMPIRRNAASGDSGKSAASDRGSAGFGFWRVFWALAIVLGAILAMRYAGKRFFGLQAPGTAAGPMRILARQTVSPKQQLMLVQVGKRLLVIANCGSQMSMLCEIRDDQEILDIVAQVKQSKPPTPGASFWSLIRREESQYEQPKSAPAAVADASTTQQADPEIAATQEELAGLLGKVKAISRTFRKA